MLRRVSAARRLCVPFCFFLPFLLVVATTPCASAAPAWVYRDLVLPQGDVALDVGLGLGHEPIGPNTWVNGWGLNLELAAGISRDVEMGVRSGLRLGADGQTTQADRYGRPFQTETYGTRSDRVANPELHVRWAVSRGSAFQLGMELRAYLPTEDQSRFGFMVAVPLSLRGGPLRIDTGIYLPVILDQPNTLTVVSVPVHFWIQAASNLWLGPLFGIRLVNQGSTHTEYPLGFGLGVALNRTIDLRTWLLLPNVNRSEVTRSFGGGMALQIRFE